MFGVSRLLSKALSPKNFGFALESVRGKATKSGGSTSNGRNSAGRRLGLKKNGGQPVISGNILIRQRGQKYRAGGNVGMGRDHTLWALTDGWLHFTDEIINQRKRKVCHVVQFDPNKAARMKNANDMIAKSERAAQIAQQLAAGTTAASSL